MKVTVLQDKCLACGACETDAPEVFSLGSESYALVLLDEIPDNLHESVKTAIANCPEGAIETA